MLVARSFADVLQGCAGGTPAGVRGVSAARTGVWVGDGLPAAPPPRPRLGSIQGVPLDLGPVQGGRFVGAVDDSPGLSQLHHPQLQLQDPAAGSRDALAS